MHNLILVMFSSPHDAPHDVWFVHMMLPHQTCTPRDDRLLSMSHIKCRFRIRADKTLFTLIRFIYRKILATLVSSNKFIIKTYSMIYLMILRPCLDPMI